MNDAATGPDERETPALERLLSAAAEDLRLLAWLHDREPDGETLLELARRPFQEHLGLNLRSEIGREALAVIDRSLAGLPEPVDPGTLDLLAVDYANIYLTFAYRASPCESVWFDDDGLERQTAMFEVRDWYRRFDLAAADESKRPDDHLVFQLQFVAHLLAQPDVAEIPGSVARFMDAHLLRWLGQFAGRTAARCQQPYFAGLALLTAAYAEELRELLAAVSGEARPDPADVDTGAGPAREATERAAQPFVPGGAPGW